MHCGPSERYYFIMNSATHSDYIKVYQVAHVQKNMVDNFNLRLRTYEPDCFGIFYKINVSEKLFR